MKLIRIFFFIGKKANKTGSSTNIEWPNLKDHESLQKFFLAQIQVSTLIVYISVQINLINI